MPPAVQDDAPPSRLQLPDWPRLMSVGYAAAYLSVSQTTFRTLGITERRIGRRVLYDRKDIDLWVDHVGSDPAEDRPRTPKEEERLFFASRVAQRAEQEAVAAVPKRR